MKQFWSPRSPYLTPVDALLWGYLKSVNKGICFKYKTRTYEKFQLNMFHERLFFALNVKEDISEMFFFSIIIEIIFEGKSNLNMIQTILNER